MNTDFWKARWKEGRIGFHEGRPNHFLKEHLATLGERRRVLVPLCGKTEDLSYLAAQGHHVVGVEVVESAAVAFFAEHGLKPFRASQGKLIALQAGEVTILVGDMFDCTPADVGAINALYDRAALIALPKPTRERYVGRLRELIPAGASGLLITVEYPQEKMEGPPFCVPEAEVRSLYSGLQIQVLGETVAQGRLKDEGIPATEKCFAIRF